MRRAGLSPAPATELVAWHDLECGTYAADLALWLELAGAQAGPVLDIGAGTGRAALTLARAGHAVTALERDPHLLEALAARARGLAVTCVCADACSFSLEEPFALCVVAMQTVHLLADRAAFLRCAHASLRPGGLLAVALLGDGVEPFDMELEPDRAERAGVLYESRPTALRLEGETMVLERRRERTRAGRVTVTGDVVRLALLTPAQLAREAAEAGFAPGGTRTVAPTEDRVGSEIVLARRPAP